MMTELVPLERIVVVDGDPLTIHEIPPVQGRVYTAIYQNRDTRQLDFLFGLYGQEQIDLQISDKLYLATMASELGNDNVARVLRCFMEIAKRSGSFVGLREDEVRAQVRTGQWYGVRERDISHAILYHDMRHGGVAYLKQIRVEGKDVLFPANLRKS